MSINWNKRLNSNPVPVTTGAYIGDGSLLSRTVEALLCLKKMSTVHLPVVTKAALWLIATSETPVVDTMDIDRVVVSADKMTMHLLYSTGRRRVEVSFAVSDNDCYITRYKHKGRKDDRLLKLAEPEAGKQFMQAIAWLDK